MSSKKKPILWTCEKCSAVALAKDSQRHLDFFCGKPAIDSEVAVITKSAMKAFNTAVDKAESFLPPETVGWEREHSILVHPQTMENFGLMPRDPLRIRFSADPSSTAISADNTVIVVVWPCKEIPLLRIHSLSSAIPRERMCLIERCQIRSVSILRCQIETSISVSVSIKEFVEIYLRNTFVQPGIALEVKYLGQKMRVYAEEPVELKMEAMNLASGDSHNSPFILSVEPKCTVQIVDKSVSNVEKDYEILELSSIGGMFNAKQILEEYIVQPERRNQTGCSVLLWGLPGSGKTFLLKRLSKILGPNCFYFSSLDELADRGNILLNMKDHRDAQSRQIVIIDVNDVEKENTKACQVLAKLLSAEERVVVILSIRSAENLELGYRVRFPVEVEITVPTEIERVDVLRKISRDYQLDESTILKISKLTHGFTSGDLCSMLKASRFARGSNSAEKIEAARKRMRPTGIRQFILEVPNISWNDIGGNEELKLEIQQAVIWPQRHADAFERYGIDPPAGILLYGPPGCSKTLVARALANEAKMNFLAVKGPELFSKWVGDSEKAIRDLFSRARQVAPTIVFFDEIDAVGSSRGSEKSSGVSDRVLAQLLTELDGLEKQSKVILLAATNRPDQLDSALLRPGRLDRAIYVGLPCDSTRRAILNMRTRKMKLDEDITIDDLVERTKGYSGAELVAVCRTAAMFAMREDIESEIVSRRHFENSLLAVVPRTEKYLLDIYDDFRAGRTFS